MGGLFAAIAAKGNGFVVGEIVGDGVVRWIEFLRVRLAVRR